MLAKLTALERIRTTKPDNVKKYFADNTVVYIVARLVRLMA